MAEKTKSETEAAAADHAAAEKTKALTRTRATTAEEQRKLTEAPKPRGILDQLQEVQNVEKGHVIGSQHQATFGAWCRAKGISAQDLAKRVREDKVQVPSDPGPDGDGPIMTEQDFEELVGFKYRNTFGEIGNPVQVVAHADPAQAKALERDHEEARRKV